jgi:hypothetical protein
MGRFGAIHRRARDRRAAFHFFQLHYFQTDDVKDISQEARTRPSREPGGKSSAYSPD